MFLNNMIENSISESQLNILESLIKYYEKELIFLEYSNIEDLNFFKYFQEENELETTNSIPSQPQAQPNIDTSAQQNNQSNTNTNVNPVNTNNTQKKNILQKIWEFLLKFFGIIKDNSQKMSSEASIEQAKNTVNDLEQVKAEDPDLTNLTSQMINVMKNDKTFRDECYKMFQEFEKTSRRRAGRNRVLLKLGSGALAIGGAYMAHQTGLDQAAVDYAREKGGEILQQGKDYVQQKVNEKGEEILQKGKDYIQGKVNDVRNAATEGINRMGEQLGEQINQTAEAFATEMSAMKNDLNKLSSKVVENSKKFISMIISGTRLAGLNIPNINVDEIMGDVYYDENGILHIPVDFRLINRHINMFMSEGGTSYEKIESSIKNGDNTRELHVQDYIMYYTLKCNKVYEEYNKNKTQHKAEYMVPFVYDGLNVYIEAAHDPVTQAIIDYVNKEYKNLTTDEKKTKAKVIRDVVNHRLNKGKTVNPNDDFSKFDPEKGPVNGTRSNSLQTVNNQKNTSLVNANATNNNSDYSSTIANGLSKLGQMASNTIEKVRSQDTTIGRAVNTAANKINEVGEKLGINLDLGLFLIRYKSYIASFYDEFMKAYDNMRNNELKDFRLELNAYVNLRENLSRKLTSVSEAINQLLQVINFIILENSKNDSSIIADKLANQLNNLSEYLNWNGNFVNNILQLFASVDEYLRGIEGLAAKLDEELAKFNENASKPTVAQQQ